MKTKTYNTTVAVMLTTCLILLFSQCKKNTCQPNDTLKRLYTLYKNGWIEECTVNGETIYGAEMNAYDAELTLFDLDGHTIGSCNPAWGSVDSICNELDNCETIYRVNNNIWGLPPIDRYGLAN